MGPPLARLLATQFTEGNCPNRLGIRAPFSLGIGIFVKEELLRELSQFLFLLVSQWLIAQGGTFPRTDCFAASFRIGVAGNRQLLALRALLAFNIRLRIFFR